MAIQNALSPTFLSFNDLALSRRVCKPWVSLVNAIENIECAFLVAKRNSVLLPVNKGELSKHDQLVKKVQDPTDEFELDGSAFTFEHTFRRITVLNIAPKNKFAPNLGLFEVRMTDSVCGDDEAYLVYTTQELQRAVRQSDLATSDSTMSIQILKPSSFKLNLPLPTDYSVGALYIGSLYNETNARMYRIGTMFIQLAVEISFQKNLQGRVCLSALDEAIEFYKLMGFIAIRKPYMYLPPNSVLAWKEKIRKNPILPTSSQLLSTPESHTPSSRSAPLPQRGASGLPPRKKRRLDNL